MYYRKIEDQRRWKKLARHSSYRGGAWYNPYLGRYIRYNQYRFVNEFERYANKEIRNYKGEISDGGSYKKLSAKIDSCY